MTVPGAAGPPERLPRTREIGPFTLTARIGAGRRTTAYIGRRDRGELIVIRELHQHIDTDVFQAELMNAKGLVVGAPHEPLSRVGLATLATGPLIIGENFATVLEDVIGSNKPINHDLALAIAMGIARQLSLLSGQVHGDLVPHHVIVGYDGSIRLIDPAGDAYRERAQAAGRVGYRSPEHVRSQPLGPQSDVFLLGVLLFEMTTAHRLFDDSAHDIDTRIVEGQVPRPRDVVGDGYPIEMQLVLRKLLRPAAVGRFADSMAARDALRLVATTRTEVGPEHISAWMRARYHESHRAWREIVGELAGEEVREEPTVALKRPASRAKTKITTKGAPPPHRSLNLDDPALENVKKQIEALEVEARALIATRGRPQSGTIPDAPVPSHDAHDAHDREATLDEGLESLLKRDTDPIKKKPRSQPRARPMELLPDLPTEITRKVERSDTIQEPLPLMLAPDDNASTTLDEIQPADELLLPMPQLAEPASLDLPQERHPVFGGVDETEPGSQREAEKVTERPDLDLLDAELVSLPPVAQPHPISARDLSADLILERQRAARVEQAFNEVLTADLLDPGPDLMGEDTIQDHDAENLLGAGLVGRLLANVEEPPPQAQARFDTELVRDREPKARSKDGDSGKPKQANISTQVVRERIEQTPLEDLEPIIPMGEPPPMTSSRPTEAPRSDAPYEGDHPPARRRAPTAPPISAKMNEQIVDDSSLGDMVIPISDAELARSRRKRWSLAAFGAVLPLVVVAAALVYLAGEEPADVVAPIEASTRIEQIGSGRPPPPPSEVERLIEPSTAADAGVTAEDAGAPMRDAAAIEVIEPVEEAPVPPPPPPAPPPPPRAPPPPPPRAPPPAAPVVPPDPPPPATPPEPAFTRVRIRVLPEEARILVNDDFEIENGGVVEVQDKPVRVTVRAEGWEERTEIIEPGRTKELILILKKEAPPP